MDWTAWAAGLFEGEGSIVFYSRQDRKWKGRMQMNIRSTDEDVIDRFMAVVGLGVKNGPYVREGNRKPQWMWQLLSQVEIEGTLESTSVYMVYQRFVNYLSRRRMAQFEAAFLKWVDEQEWRIAGDSTGGAF